MESATPPFSKAAAGAGSTAVPAPLSGPVPPVAPAASPLSPGTGRAFRTHPPFLLGVNYWPSRHGVEMWRDWQPEAIAAELQALAATGCRVVRFFLRWVHFQPEEDRIDPTALQRLRQFCDLAWDAGLGVIPTFFTGHMSGENWDVPWRRARCPYTDPAMLRAQVRLVRAVAETIGDHPALLAWDLANEPDIFARPPSPDAGWLWCRLLYRELKAVTPAVPVTLGIHVASLVDDCGFRPADVAEAADFVCMHLYPIYSSWCPDPAGTVRPNLLVPFGDRLVAAMGRRPALAEEFGSTTLMMSPELHGRYVSAVLGSLLLHGSLGAVAWCGLDFTCAEELPYDSTPYEVAFGILDAEGRPKPAGAAFARFARMLQRLPTGLRPALRPAAILLPERYYDNADPDVTPERNFAVLFNAFVLARRAGLPVDLVRPDDDWSGYRLLIVPCVPRRNSLSTRTWNRLRRWVEGGGTLYLSYDGVALPGMEEVFGVAVRDAYPREAVHGPGPWELVLGWAGLDHLPADEPAGWGHAAGGEAEAGGDVAGGPPEGSPSCAASRPTGGPGVAEGDGVGRSAWGGADAAPRLACGGDDVGGTDAAGADAGNDDAEGPANPEGYTAAVPGGAAETAARWITRLRPSRFGPRKRLLAEPRGAAVAGWIRPARQDAAASGTGQPGAPATAGPASVRATGGTAAAAHAVAGEQATGTANAGTRGDRGNGTANAGTPGERAIAEPAEPAVFVHRYGQGWAVLVTDPLEWLLAGTPGAYRDDRSHEIYRLAARLARLDLPWQASHPDVEVGLLVAAGEPGGGGGPGGAGETGGPAGAGRPVETGTPGVAGGPAGIGGPGGTGGSRGSGGNGGSGDTGSANQDLAYLVVVNHHPEPVTVTLLTGGEPAGGDPVRNDGAGHVPAGGDPVGGDRAGRVPAGGDLVGGDRAGRDRPRVDPAPQAHAPADETPHGPRGPVTPHGPRGPVLTDVESGDHLPCAPAGAGRWCSPAFQLEPGAWRVFRVTRAIEL
ncbi:Beta-galactosidase trimerisation domain protein [Thermaerobacter marianensis DSM 12885]|uniref:Beta-galactosidase trimerisation domain protein n=1 Tax=Thermaerobacter marianensis (strain ATCC 700841 / DSM 12885 / JCM 10246 / 7p75a) TaxID=644966 RepID=E6SGR1_THEM7|nr:Beta-galactosidase trimerisation domain protein [Thermaerobacter marianensis DSM 12885]